MLHVQTSLFWWLDNCVDAAIFPSTQFWHGKLQEENMMPWYAMLTASHTSIRKSGSENLVATTFFPSNQVWETTAQFVNLSSRCWQPGQLVSHELGQMCCVDFYWAWNPWNPWNLASAVWVSLGWICLLMFCDGDMSICTIWQTYIICTYVHTLPCVKCSS